MNGSSNIEERSSLRIFQFCKKCGQAFAATRDKMDTCEPCIQEILNNVKRQHKL
jgi:hypothetical protein